MREMRANSQDLVQGSEYTCDAEPIHIPGSIQRHGLLLLLDAESGKLAHWAGDFDRLLGLTPSAGLSARELLGTALDNLIGSCLLNAGDEPVHVGCIRPQARPSLAMMAHRTGCFVAVELVEAAPEGTAASALDQVRAISHRIAASNTLAEAFDSAAEQVRSIAGFDRVMIYRFLDDGSGSVDRRVPCRACDLLSRAPLPGLRHSAPGPRLVPAQPRPRHSRRRRTARSDRAGARRPADRHVTVHPAQRLTGPHPVSEEHGGRRIHVDFPAGRGRAMGPDRLPPLPAAVCPGGTAIALPTCRNCAVVVRSELSRG